MSHYLHLARTGRRDQHGCEVLKLSLMSGGGTYLESVEVVSGAPGRQVFRSLAEEVRGRLEPIPEGEYQLGPVEWAGAVGDYSASWGSGLGPVWIDCNHSAIGIHLDANRANAPGTAGCVGAPTVEVLKAIVAWLTQYKITRLVVDWGLGTVSSNDVETLKIFAHSGKWQASHNGKSQPSAQVRIDAHSGKISLSVGGQRVKIASLELVAKYLGA